MDEPSVIIIPHQMPTSAERRAEIRRKIDAGEPLGASHVHDPLPPGTMVVGSVAAVPQYSKLSPSLKERWMTTCPGASNKEDQT
jgi:hypothetical protein